MEDLIEHVEQYLDIDPRYFNINDGSFLWGDDEVTFRKTPDSIFLEINGVIYIANRT